jgi:hypothetical protein
MANTVTIFAVTGAIGVGVGRADPASGTTGCSSSQHSNPCANADASSHGENQLNPFINKL